MLTRLIIIALTAVGAVLTFKYAGKHYRAWVLLTALLGISATLFFLTYMDGPNVNAHAAILITYVVGAGLCLGRRGVVFSSLWLALNYLLLAMLANWNLWPRPVVVSVEKVQHENLSTMFFLLLILIPLLLGYMAQIEKSIRKLRQSSVEHERLLQRLITVREEERRRIAHILHEGPVQGIAALRLMVLNEMSRNEMSRNEIIPVIDDALAELRTLSSDLYPASLTLYGLPVALDQLADQHQQVGATEVQVRSREPELESIDPQVGIVLFRIAQEALNNIRKHSNAQRAWIQLEQENNTLTLEVRDDGQGFDVEPVLRQAVQTGHLGLATLHELALSVGGTLRIESRPREGTLVMVSVPYRKSASRSLSEQLTYRREENVSFT